MVSVYFVRCSCYVARMRSWENSIVHVIFVMDFGENACIFILNGPWSCSHLAADCDGSHVEINDLDNHGTNMSFLLAIHSH